jgi:1,4-alpha-glucan branching enzyme
MQVFRVWAPYAKKMAVQAGDVRAAMHGPDERGWWSADRR